MTPLAPLYLLGVLTIAGPILFHLWRRTPRGRREFSTLMFLTPSPPRVTSRSRVEHWMLLLLRGVVLALLALAFARPLWRANSTESEAAAGEELVAVLVDTSASVRRDGVWEDLRKQIAESLSNLPTGATVALFSFDDQFRTHASFTELKRLDPGARRNIVRSRFEDLKPGWGGTRLGDALVQTASALLEAQVEKSVPAKMRIILAGDYASGANLDSLHGYEWPADLRVESLVGRSASPSNAGIQIVERNLDLGDNQLRVRITNSADSKKENFAVRWDDNESNQISVYVPPGQSRVIVPPARTDQQQGTSLILSGDDHTFDNTVYVTPPSREMKSVLYDGVDSVEDPDGLRFYLNGVFAASSRYQVELLDWNSVDSSNGNREAIGNQLQKTVVHGEISNRLGRDVLVVMTHPVSDVQPLLTAHFDKGGTVLIVARSAEEGTNALKLCGLNDVSLAEASGRRDAILTDIDFKHPLFAPFAESQFSDFTGIRYWKHRTLMVDGKRFVMDSTSLPHQGRVLARFDDGSPAFAEFNQAKGRVWLLTSGWQPSDSQLARSSKFPPLIYRILEQATGSESSREGLRVGGQLVSTRSGRTEAAEEAAIVQRPDGVEVDVPLDDAGKMKVITADTPGVYTFRQGVYSETSAVNLSPDESRTSPISMEYLEGFGVKIGTASRPEDIRRQADRKRQLQIVELEESQKLWRWGLLIAIGLLLLETWFAGRKSPPSLLSETSENE